MTKVKIPNRGDITEGIVAAAIAAKLSARDGSSIGMVTVDDVVQQVMRVESKGEPVTNVVPDLDGDYQDEITFSITLPNKAFAALLDRSKIKHLIKEYEGAVKYVNSAPMHEFATLLAKNEKSNQVLVEAAGTKNQKGTKVDISTIVDGVVKGSQLSLKVSGGNQFAQKVGKAFNVQEAFWNPLGVDLSSLQTEYDLIVSKIPDGKPFTSRQEIDEGGYLQMTASATTLIYRQAHKNLESRMVRDRFGIEFLKILADYISENAVGSSAGKIKLVHIESSDFKCASFGTKFVEQMEKAHLYPVLDLNLSYPVIKIMYKPLDYGEPSVLVQMRAKVERASGNLKVGKRYGVLMRNYLESGPALYKIAAI